MKHHHIFAIGMTALVLLTACVQLGVGYKSSPDNVAISSDGVPIRFNVYGEGKPALVFVHGWCGDRTNWAPILDAYSKHYKVVTIDLPGFGESGRDREAWSMGAYGEDVMSVVKRLKLNQVILIGYSMGDKVIVEAARRMPERIVALVGIDNFRNIDPWPAEQIKEWTAPLKTDFEDAMQRLSRNAIHPSRDSAGFVDRLLSQMGDCASPPEIAIPIIEAYFAHDLKPALKEIEAPLRAINSDLWPTDIEILQRYNPSFRVVSYSGTGHFILWVDPEKLIRHLSGVLAEFTGSSAAQ